MGVACRIAKLKWKMGKETVGKKMEDHHSLKFNEMAQCSFQPQQPLVCDSLKNCSSTNIEKDGISRLVSSQIDCQAMLLSYAGSKHIDSEALDGLLISQATLRGLRCIPALG